MIEVRHLIPLVPTFLIVVSTGCATKKFVLGRVNPVEQRVTVVEKKSAGQDSAIEDLENSQSRTSERVQDLEAGLKANADRTAEANSRASQASSEAQTAQSQAADARRFAETRSTAVERYVDARDQLKLRLTLNVQFALARSDLDSKAREQLDSIAGEMRTIKRFTIEVQGFTDSTGPAQQNLELSRRRAESIVRYLTSTHGLPLRTIHLIGSGSASPVAANNTERGRRLNRRVEVRLFVPEVDEPSAITSAHTQGVRSAPPSGR